MNKLKSFVLILLGFVIMLLISLGIYNLIIINLESELIRRIFFIGQMLLSFCTAIMSLLVLLELRVVNEKINEQNEKLELANESNDDILETLVKVIDAKDSYTYHHSKRVAYYAKSLAYSVGLKEDVAQRIFVTGMLHDIGKIGLSEEILNKQTQLDEDEKQMANKHTVIGSHIAENLNCFKDVIPGIYYHHEKFDGTGYPEGLIGQEIPISARIIAISDAFDAMTSDRSYRKGMSPNDAISRLLESIGSQFDPFLVINFVDLVRNKQLFEKARMN